MDNASYQSRQKKYFLVRYISTKVEIKNVVIDNNIYFKETKKKRELVNSENYKVNKKYVCDINNRKWTMLRLPLYYCVFDATV